MKKSFFAVLLLTAALSVYAQTGVIKEVTGTVELKRSSAAGFVVARAGDTVAQDTIISTGLKSTATIEVGSALMVALPLTRLTLTEIHASQSSDSLNVNLQAGRMRVEVTPLAGHRASMTVTGPSSTASVRGTSFYFDTRNIHVDHGSVLFKGSRGYTVEVGPGNASAVGWNGNAAPAQYTGRSSGSSSHGAAASQGSRPAGQGLTSANTGGSGISAGLPPGTTPGSSTPGTNPGNNNSGNNNSGNNNNNSGNNNSGGGYYGPGGGGNTGGNTGNTGGNDGSGNVDIGYP